MRRRTFLKAAAMAGPVSRAIGSERRAPVILLRSSWQVVNIGDIAHTPGVLAILETHLPDAEVVLWASRDLSDEVIRMEHRRFPRLKVVKGTIGQDGKASNAGLGAAVARADFLLHGSGPSLVGKADVAAFAEHTGKPYGVYGITYAGSGPADRGVYDGAKFLLFRDSASLAKARADGIECPVMAFGPDGAFAVDLRDDERATAFLRSNGLEDGKFLCCIPRLRGTPYWTIHGRPMTEADRAQHLENERMKEHDHAPLRAAIEAVVRETDLKVLVCPEDRSQMAVGRENLVDKLPGAIRERVVWREHFWLTDEALSTYVRSAGLFGHEMHSPIMCVGNGIPAIVCRWPRQTSKGLMWWDIGLGDWLFDMDNPDDVAKIVPAVLGLAKDPAGARRKAATAKRFVEARQRETIGILKTALRV